MRWQKLVLQSSPMEGSMSAGVVVRNVRFLGTTILGLAAVLVACSNEKALPEIETVVLISIDSLRADRLGVYGHTAPTSPTLDRLATEGLLFKRAYSTTSWTLPSHAAMLTGLDDYAHGAYQALSPISDGVVTLAERLEKAGTESTGFFAGPFLHPTYGFARGFDQYIDATSYGWKTEGKPSVNIPHDASHRDVTNPIILNKVSAWLDDRTARRNATEDTPHRSFVFIHLWDVHYDYIPPPEYVKIFDPDYTGSLSGDDFRDNPLIRPNMPKRDLQHLLALYDAEIRYTDDTIAQILELFDAHGMLETTAVIVTADHGEEFFDHGRTGHGLTLHEEVVRVPLILWLSGRRPVRSTSEQVVSLIDIAPTVCELLAVDCGYSGIGNSLVPDYMEQNPPARRQDALIELTNAFLKLEMTARVDSGGSILSDNRSGKLFYSSSGGSAAADKPVQLNEKTLDRHPQAIRTAANQLRKRSAEAKELGAMILRGETADAKPIDPHTLEQLKLLGYLEEGTPVEPSAGAMPGEDANLTSD
jgi:arylsulfatase A-like enzyme